MSFLEHLEELRGRLIISFTWFILTTIIGGFFFYKPVLDIIQKPLGSISFKERPMITLRVAEDGAVRFVDDVTTTTLASISHYQMMFEFEGNPGETFVFGPDYQSNLFYFSVFAPYMLILKVVLLIGVFLSLPMWLWQVWLFVAPGLKRGERKVVLPVIWSSLFLFPAGAAFAYFVLFIAIKVLTGFQLDWLEPRLDVAKYLNFVVSFMLIFGLLFQTPLIIVLLVRMGLLSTAFLKKNRKYSFLIIMLISALLTPQDPFTMLAMGLPLVILLEISIWVAAILERKEKEEEEEAKS